MIQTINFVRQDLICPRSDGDEIHLCIPKVPACLHLPDPSWFCYLINADFHDRTADWSWNDIGALLQGNFSL